MPRARHILAVTLVATALCADRAVAAAAPSLQQQTEARTVSFAGRLVQKLSSNFRRDVPVIRLCEMRRGDVASPVGPQVAPVVVRFSPPQISPFYFRLPPPAV